MSRWSGWLRAVSAVTRHPSLWRTAVRQLRVLAIPHWWRRPPFVPRPDPAYLRFRLLTAYGDPHRAPAGEDLVAYLRWCRTWPVLVTRG